MKRQYTRLIFEARFDKGTGIRVYYVYNKGWGNPKDVIRVLIKAVKENIEFFMRIDEAVILAAGLNKVAGQMLIEQLPFVGEIK
ncbi:hypothetical protein LCGC14_1353340 [marine sediment metagenome]|uniref:Uncharacterized protein n=1 Tax=marine sediment metagenome TaxID=412755 RepID=A0A0F9KAV5_9ZZZZ|nr:hypothetical protein [Candidatus Aminicenantes bacterium]